MPELVESLNCPKCGAPLPIRTGDAIVTCRYCGTSSRVRGDLPFVLRSAMLPARIDRAGAEAALGGWLTGGFLKPDDLRRESRVTSLECAYVPFYVFEVDVVTAYAGVLTRTGTNERRSGEVPRDYFWKVLGRRTGDVPVREYKIPLSLKVPFDTSLMVPGSTFLNAELDEDEAARIAHRQVEEHERELLKDLVDVVEDVRTRIAVKDAEFLHAPLWFAAYAYRGRTYRVVIDGASGEVVRGDLPPPDAGLGGLLRSAGRGLLGG